MQIVLNKSKPNIMSICCLFILGATLLFVIPGDKTPLEMQVVVITQLIILLLSSVVFWWSETQNKGNYLSVILLISSLIIICSIFVFQSTLIIYYDDCNEIILLDNGVNISRNDCINYTIENPDTTGAEIVNHFKQNVKEKEITSVLERQLEP